MSARLSSAELLSKPELWASADLPFLPEPGASSQLAKYMEMLLAWNRVLNLSACRNPLDLLRALILDSFFLAAFLDSLLAPAPSPRVFDPGAGAGLPGIPLRIFWQRGNYTMIEARQKRALFLANALALLKLPRTEAVCGRAEQSFASEQPAHCIVSRAFMPWPKLLNFCKPGLVRGGVVVIMANEQPPILKAPLEETWKLKASLEYFVQTKPRWFWAMTPKD